MISAVGVAAFLMACGGTDDQAFPTGPTQPTTATTPGPTTGATPAPTTGATRAPSCQDPPCYGQPRRVGTLDPDLVDQVSGMSASWRTPGAFYAISDLAGTSEVVAITEDGEPIAHIEIAGMAAKNAEALSVGACGDAHPNDTCLYIGDIGDHSCRSDIVIYRLPEPDLGDPPTAPLAADALRYTYPDAPTDAEALMVDDAGRPLIVNKPVLDCGAGASTRLFRGGTDGGVLEHLGDINLPEPESPVFTLIAGNVVTAADTLSDGRVILRTYDEVLEYRADEPNADPATFPDWPLQRAPSPFQVQSETVSYRADGCGYLTTAEMGGEMASIDCSD